MSRVGPRDIRCACALAFAALASGCGAPVEPLELDDRHALTILYHQLGGPGWMKSDNWVTDAPLDTWFGVEVDSEGNVTGLDLNRNRVIGEIPGEIGMLESLKILDLGNYVIMGPDLWDRNRLTGEIPGEMGMLGALEQLILTGNALTGSIPRELGNLRSLRSLHLSSNELTGSIPPELGNLRNLTTLRLAVNKLTGSIPRELGNLRNLTTLQLSTNKLTGFIPGELGNLRNLGELFLYRNSLTGSIPPELGNLANLQELIFASNHLTGRLPAELIRVPLRAFSWRCTTGLCAPLDDTFQEWLKSIRWTSGPNCASG